MFGYADFGWGDVIGEFDGKGKYGVGRVTDPHEAGQIVYAEKLREDRIRRSGLGVARWGWAELRRPSVIRHRIHQARASSGQRHQRATPPDAPGPMAFRDSARVLGILEAAGLAGGKAERIDADLHNSGGVDAVMRLIGSIGVLPRIFRGERRPPGRPRGDPCRGPHRARTVRHVLADEINRATPKTQSALLEAMQEHSVTVGGTIHKLKEPFFVMATQNPIEQEGTYPAARGAARPVPVQARRRLLDPRGADDDPRPDDPRRAAAGREGHRRRDADPDAGAGPRGDRRPARPGLRHPAGPGHPPRGAVRRRRHEPVHPLGVAAPAASRRSCSPPRSAPCSTAGINVSFEDLRRVYLPSLRHRVLLNFEAQAEGVESDDVLLKVLDAVPEKAEEARRSPRRAEPVPTRPTGSHPGSSTHARHLRSAPRPGGRGTRPSPSRLIFTAGDLACLVALCALLFAASVAGLDGRADAGPPDR